MARTAKFYLNRFEKSRRMARSMGFVPHETNVLVLRNQGTTSDPRWREEWRSDANAADLLISGDAIRAAVSNNERSVHLWVDPSFA